MLSDPVSLGMIYAAFVTPIATVLMRAHFSGFPADLIDAAKVDGSSEARAFFRVVLPMSMKTMVVVALLQAIFIWNDLGLALILLLDGESQTLPVGIALFKGQYTSDPAAQYGLLLISLLPILILYVIARKRITAGMQIGALK
jgi:ABC-type glycerol-3-phosphate transport system permease component